MPPLALFTLGHSNHPEAAFLSLLARHRVDAVADVRSVPASRRHPQFGQRRLRAALEAHGIAYHFLGRELGARSPDPAHHHEGRVDFARLAAGPGFGAGLAEVERIAAAMRLALLCAEREPLDCHRTLLVARALVRRGAAVHHILADGTLEPHAGTEVRLLARTGTTPLPLFDDPDARAAALERAYALRGAEIAWRPGDA